MKAQLVLFNELLIVEVDKVNALDLHEGPRNVKAEKQVFTWYFDEISLFRASSTFWTNFGWFGAKTKLACHFNCDQNFVDKSEVA